MWIILKVFIESVMYSFCFMFYFFGHKACGILAPQPGIKPALTALEGKVLTIGSPGKSLFFFFFIFFFGSTSRHVELSQPEIKPVSPAVEV